MWIWVSKFLRIFNGMEAFVGNHLGVPLPARNPAQRVASSAPTIHPPAISVSAATANAVVNY